MNYLVTGGAGFIGRWVVKRLLEEGHAVWVLDNLSSGSRRNLSGLESHPAFSGFVCDDIRRPGLLDDLFERRFDVCVHLAASINVQDSIDDPRSTFDNDVLGTLNVLEACRRHGTRLAFMSTCLVYDGETNREPIDERHPVDPVSPYAGAKLAAEQFVVAYHRAYGLPVVVMRQFNTFGPFQKATGEGGVVAIFLRQKLKGEPLNVYGDGMQSRDFLYVEDGADFVARCSRSDTVTGQIVNAGRGQDVKINDLARRIVGDPGRIRHVSHIHPQSEIPRLLSDCSKARDLLGWRPRTSLTEGLALTESWIAGEIEAGRL
jgi:nucleoside-diphosphate-sugar epimerase